MVKKKNKKKTPLASAGRHNRHRINPWGGKIPWRRAQKFTPVFLPGESHGQKSLAGHGAEDHQGSDTTEVTQHAHTHSIIK